jgi:hypothetical protein
MSKFSVYRDIGTVSQGHVRDIQWVIDRIRSGASKDLVERIRALPTKSERDELKKGLTSICFSGVFRKREDKAIHSHSGYMIADFDHVDDIQALKDTLTGDPYVHLFFVSPSGDGIKAVVKVPPIIEEHKARFTALMEHFGRSDFDPKNGNLSRVCYESYDPDLYFNPESKVFEEKAEARPVKLSEARPRVVLHSADKIIEKLQKWSDRKFPITEGQRNDNLFRFASAMNRCGVPKMSAENYLRQYAQEGFEVDEIIRVVTSAYRDTAAHGLDAFADDDTENHIRSRYNEGAAFDVISDEVKAYIPDDQTRKDTIERVVGEVDSETFWTKSKQGAIKIDHYKFKYFLQEHGFMKFYPTPGAMFVFVRVVDNLVSGSTEEAIKDFVLDYVENTIADRSLYNHMAGKPLMFKKEYLSMLDPITLPFVTDEATFGTLFYRNKAVRTHKDGRVELIDYTDLRGYVWSDHILERDFEPDEVDGEWNYFMELISGQNPERVKAHRTTIGYLIHGYKGKTNNVAVIYNDGVINDNPNGGSGNGIIMQAIGRMRRVSTIDGKAFSFDKGFPYQTVSADTQVLLFDDVNKRFNFERLFSVITEGIELEKKNKDAVRIPVEKSPKVVITTNYTIQGKGGSHDRRKWEVEMSPYFNATRRPYDIFKHNLFDDWDELQWRRFDNYMAECLLLFLKHGLFECSWETQHIRKFINETSAEFWEWLEDESSEPKLKIDQIIYRSALMDEFIKEYPDWDRHKYNLSGRKWAIWLQAYGEFKGWEVISSKNSTGGHYTKYVLPGTIIDIEHEEVTDEAPF